MTKLFVDPGCMECARSLCDRCDSEWQDEDKLRKLRDLLEWYGYSPFSSAKSDNHSRIVKVAVQRNLRTLEKRRLKRAQA